jgi:hypothetical protein
MENLANAVNLAAIAIPEPPRDMKEHLAIFPRKDSNGSLLVTIDFPVRMVDLRASNEPLQTKLLSVARLISSLDATCIRPLFASFQELISTQRDMAHRLKAELQPIIDRRSRFACEFSVTNFGATPFVLSAENVRVFVRRDSSEAVQECALLLSEAETGKLVPAPTITVIEAGKSGIYIASTVKAIEEIDEGQELIGAFNKGNRKARVSVDLMGREFSKFRSITSDDVGFKAGSTQRL